MRINQYIATATGLSRRAADKAINGGRVTVNGRLASTGQQIDLSDDVRLDNRSITPVTKIQTIILNKPTGYVCSRNGQGSQTIYDLLPGELHNLKPVGRLDKDSSGLLLLTNDGKLAHQLTHPSFAKEKVYEVTLSKPLRLDDKAKIETGVQLEDGLSVLRLRSKEQGARSRPKNFGTLTPYSISLISTYEVRMAEGRNRQIRRTFAALGYKVTELHRIQFGPYSLDELPSGKYKIL